ncbi:MAG: T9SS type A sorting domain-containing protein [Sphingobacteriales bacterium]|nr:T9SS type A sorting domain-containing protein [Sphingobacteriales bacterium]MBK7528703.1 T9SS type A sorting domain-containing protein [Sphingobacteriales bacterium]MBL0246803.1 T9SS type A sorting domain-containing protein [Sphingobacteriales bacterium]
MVKRIILLGAITMCSIFFLSSICKAQETVNKFQNYPENIKKAQISFQTKPLSGKKVADILPQLAPSVYQQEGGNLQLNNQQSFLTHTVYNYRQYYFDTPIYNAYFQVTVDASHKNIRMIADNTLTVVPNPQLSGKSFANLIANSEQLKNTIIETYIAQQAGNNNEKPTLVWHEWVFFAPANEPVNLALVAHFTTNELHDELVFDVAGNILLKRDIRNFYGCKGKCRHLKTEDAEATGTGLVFNPDPLTSANIKNYGTNGKYMDNDDADSPELNAQLQTKTLDLSFENNIYKLKNNWVEIGDISMPYIAPPTSADGNFFYNRGQDGFEDVNAFYHITSCAKYIAGLGFSNFNTKVLVDAHGLTADQSSHSVSGNNHTIKFGEGGVDDAEDADVIVHEYTHALSAMACPNNCNDGFERKALDEALGDYMATSYSRELNELNWEKMFTWDGHNPFFQGRNMNTNKHYPENIVATSIYETSEIFSGCLMDIYEVVGKQITDRLVLSALTNFTGNINFKDAAQIILLHDDLLFGGANRTALIEHFTKRGLLEYSIDAGKDQTICLGDTIYLGSPAANYANAKIYWTVANEPHYYQTGNIMPALDVLEPYKPYAAATPDKSQTYVLNVEDKFSGLLYQDSINVTVNYCFDPTPGQNIELLNTDRFMKARGEVVIKVPKGTTRTQLEIYDAAGRRLEHVENFGDAFFTFSKGNLRAGVYLVHIKTDTHQLTQKLVLTR